MASFWHFITLLTFQYLKQDAAHMSTLPSQQKQPNHNAFRLKAIEVAEVEQLMVN